MEDPLLCRALEAYKRTLNENLLSAPHFKSTVDGTTTSSSSQRNVGTDGSLSFSSLFSTSSESQPFILQTLSIDGSQLQMPSLERTASRSSAGSSCGKRFWDNGRESASEADPQCNDLKKSASTIVTEHAKGYFGDDSSQMGGDLSTSEEEDWHLSYENSSQQLFVPKHSLPGSEVWGGNTLVKQELESSLRQCLDSNRGENSAKAVQYRTNDDQIIPPTEIHQTIAYTTPNIATGLVNSVEREPLSSVDCMIQSSIGENNLYNTCEKASTKQGSEVKVASDSCQKAEKRRRKRDFFFGAPVSSAATISDLDSQSAGSPLMRNPSKKIMRVKSEGCQRLLADLKSLEEELLSSPEDIRAAQGILMQEESEEDEELALAAAREIRFWRRNRVSSSTDNAAQDIARFGQHHSLWNKRIIISDVSSHLDYVSGEIVRISPRQHSERSTSAMIPSRLESNVYYFGKQEEGELIRRKTGRKRHAYQKAAKKGSSNLSAGWDDDSKTSQGKENASSETVIDGGISVSKSTIPHVADVCAKESVDSQRVSIVEDSRAVGNTDDEMHFQHPPSAISKEALCASRSLDLALEKRAETYQWNPVLHGTFSEGQSLSRTSSLPVNDNISWQDWKALKKTSYSGEVKIDAGMKGVGGEAVSVSQQWAPVTTMPTKGTQEHIKIAPPSPQEKWLVPVGSFKRSPKSMNVYHDAQENRNDILLGSMLDGSSSSSSHSSCRPRASSLSHIEEEESQPQLGEARKICSLSGNLTFFESMGPEYPKLKDHRDQKTGFPPGFYSVRHAETPSLVRHQSLHTNVNHKSEPASDMPSFSCFLEKSNNQKNPPVSTEESTSNSADQCLEAKTLSIDEIWKQINIDMGHDSPEFHMCPSPTFSINKEKAHIMLQSYEYEKGNFRDESAVVSGINVLDMMQIGVLPSVHEDEVLLKTSSLPSHEIKSITDSLNFRDSGTTGIRHVMELDNRCKKANFKPEPKQSLWRKVREGKGRAQKSDGMPRAMTDTAWNKVRMKQSAYGQAEGMPRSMTDTGMLFRKGWQAMKSAFSRRR